MPIFRYSSAGAMDDHGQLFLAQRVKTGLNRSIVVSDNWITIGRLIASGCQRIKGERIDLRSRALLFEKATDNSGFNHGELQGHNDLDPLRPRILASLISVRIRPDSRQYRRCENSEYQDPRAS